MELKKEHGTENKGLTVSLKLADTDIFKALLKECSSILEDERIDKAIRKEYCARFEIIMKENINR